MHAPPRSYSLEAFVSATAMRTSQALLLITIDPMASPGRIDSELSCLTGTARDTLARSGSAVLAFDTAAGAAAAMALLREGCPEGSILHLDAVLFGRDGSVADRHLCRSVDPRLELKAA